MIGNIVIGDRNICAREAPLIVAEMSGNHNQSLNQAIGIVEAAATSGAHALKLQTYTADTMTIDVNGDGFSVTDSNSPWYGRSLYDLYEEAHTPWEWHEAIFDRCRELGLIPISTPFDETSVEFLEQFDLPAYKVASFENTDLPLLRRIASTGKPMIISTGMTTLTELSETIEEVRTAGCEQLVLLKCTSSYPANPSFSNLMTIPHMRQLFGTEVGLSDHTLGIGAAIAAVALGATVIEKHFTLSRADGGVDSQFSLEPDEMASLVIESERAWNSLGEVFYAPTEPEVESLVFRRSLYFVEDIESGGTITQSHIRRIRPGLGIPPKHEEEIIGRKVRAAVKRGWPVTWELLE
ncbi:MAG: pseudaminic acid synthase [Candidatus Latescibacteria bacterium]|jgi:pseudaminic acid synthase|nr:pseudaminic acid synthase [Candidatus Latescibacterota bacterium]